MQEEWGAGVSQWVARREIERVNLYFRRKMGILKGHSTDEWNEGYGEWQDRALISQAWKWLRRPRKPMPRSRAKRRMVACVRESVDRSASRRRRISSPRQAAPKTEAREAKPPKQPEASADHLATEDSDEEEILSTEPVTATYEGIYVFSQKTEKRHGPYTMMQLQKLVDQGYFTAHDLAIYHGLEQWVTLEQVPDIRFPVVEAPAEPEAEPEPAAEEILAPEEDAPALTTELVEDAESDQQQAETPGKRNLAGSLFRVVAVVCAFLILFLYLCDIVNQRMGWKIPIGLGLAGIETVPARVNAPNPEVAEIGDTDGGKGADEETEAHETVQPPPQPAQPVFLTQGLIAYYPFDGNALDMSGNGRNGTVTDAKPTTDRLGLKAKALSFDGRESHVRIALIPDMNEVSISVWAKFPTMLKRGTIFCDSTPTFGNDFFFQVSPERLIVRADKSGSSLWERFDVDLTQQKEQWMHLCSVVSIKQCTVYANGSRVGFSEKTGNNIGFHNPSGAVIGIGDWWGKVRDEPFEGSLDDFRIYDRALSVEEVNALYAHEKTMDIQKSETLEQIFLEKGLVAYYPFDGNAKDMSGNGHHGTVHGATFGKDRYSNSANAMTFDGLGDYIDLGNDPKLDVGSNNFTLATWIRKDSATGIRDILAKRKANPHHGWVFQIWGSIRLWSEHGSFDTPLPSGLVNNWLHISIVRNIVGATAKLFIDGRIVNTGSFSGQDLSNSNRLSIGRLSGEDDHYFDGSIDEVRIYERALSDVEVATLYNHEKPVGAKAVVVSNIESVPVVDGKPFTISDLDLEMLWCPPGTFVMGSPTTEAGRKKYETQHQVTLTEGYWLGKYEVTQAQWEKVVGSNPSRFKGVNRPVEKVSWNDVTSFCEKLTEMERKVGSLPAGMSYQLPTEAQWEYACRAGTTTVYAFGDSLTWDQANIRGGPDETTDVGKYPANAWGFYDMHGNVREWCADWHWKYPTSAVSDPLGPAAGSGRVRRGGSWDYTAGIARSADRYGDGPAFSYYSIGFRLSLRPASK
jgi:formylglycine-generating enzyme required for sulfatase activity